jgi:(+)-trans-carveol dehydrogenase
MAGLLEGKAAVVTGAARGQGRSHCVRLAEEGADIVAIDICGQIATAKYAMSTPEDLQETVRLVESLDRRILPTQADVREYAAVAAAVDQGAAQLGRLDVVVANAGIAPTTPAIEISQDEWRDTVDTDLTGVWNVCRAALPHLIDGKRGGSMILTSSAVAHVGFANLVHYSAAKAGLVGLMRSLAVELGPHMIRVNTIHPTVVNTPMVQNQTSYDIFDPDGSAEKGEEGVPAQVIEAMKTINALPIPWVEAIDVSNVVVFLASDQGRYITGSEIRVDAGAAAK